MSAGAGRLRWLGDAELLERWRAEIEAAAAEARNERRRLEHGALAGFYKGSPLRGKHALRHAVRRALGMADVPRLQEFRNLAWLRQHGFLAPRPLLAGVFERCALPRFQFLVSEWLPAPSLEEFSRSASPAERVPVLAALATDLARLHALGFVHRDLFARNLLVVGSPARVAFVDAWRGGPRIGARGPMHDLACLFLDLSALVGSHEQAELLKTYRSASQAEGRRLPPDWLTRLEAGRAAVLGRERHRRRDPLPAQWSAPRL